MTVLVLVALFNLICVIAARLARRRAPDMAAAIAILDFMVLFAVIYANGMMEI